MSAFFWIGAAATGLAALFIALWDETRIVVVDVERSREIEVSIWDA